MKVEVSKNSIHIITENSFEVLALDHFAGKRAQVVIETYHNNGKYTTGFAKISFESEKTVKE